MSGGLCPDSASSQQPLIPDIPVRQAAAILHQTMSFRFPLKRPGFFRCRRDENETGASGGRRRRQELPARHAGRPACRGIYTALFLPGAGLPAVLKRRMRRSQEGSGGAVSCPRTAFPAGSVPKRVPAVSSRSPADHRPACPALFASPDRHSLPAGRGGIRHQRSPVHRAPFSGSHPEQQQFPARVRADLTGSSAHFNGSVCQLPHRVERTGFCRRRCGRLRCLRPDTRRNPLFSRPPIYCSS